MSIKKLYMLRARHPIREVQFITVPFGKRYIFGFHQGVDFRTKHASNSSGIGTPIRAIASGKWGRVDSNKAFGNYVEIEHPDSYKSVYGHLKYSTYKNGYVDVKSGDIIGYSGGLKQGITTGPHLHLELHRKGKKIDPMLAIKEGDKIRKWGMHKPLLRVNNSGGIYLFYNGGFVKLNMQNCWDVISQNARGVSEKDYKDLLDLL